MALDIIQKSSKVETPKVPVIKQQEKGILGKYNCPECGSNDNLVVYVKYDDNGDEDLDGTCFTPACENARYLTHKELEEQGILEEGINIPKVKMSKREPITEEQFKELWARTSFDTTMKDGSLYRGIRTETAQFYGHRYERSGDGEIIREYYPETLTGWDSGFGQQHGYKEYRGFKSRDLPKTFGWHNIGITGKTNCFSGQHLFPNGGKRVIITAGEVDKLSAQQMMYDYQVKRNNDDYGRVAIVGVHVGEGSLASVCALQYEWLDLFEEIVLVMDGDQAGRDATQEALRVLPEGKARLVKMPDDEDCNSLLLNGLQRKFISYIYDAKPVVDSGIISSTQAMEGIREYLLAPKITLPDHLVKLQNAMRGGIKSTGAIINIVGKTSIGKCLGKDTPVLMYDFSVKKVQDVLEGDLLMGDDGTPRTVLSLAQGREKMYKISQVNGMTYTVNASHILSLRAGYDTPNYSKGQIVNINVEDYVKLSYTDKRSLKGYKGDFTKYQTSDNYESRAYLLGLWLAEGSCHDSSITINNEMLSVLEAEVAKTDYTLTERASKSDKCSTLYVKGGFKQWLREIGVLNNKHVPDFIFNSSVETRYELIAGYLDGDGYKVSNGFEVITKQDKLAETFIKLCKSVSLTCTNRKVEKSCQNDFTGVYNRMFVFGMTDLIPNKLERKKVNSKSQLRYKLNTAITVEELPEDEYYGFVIDGNHLFCLEDGTVTHNTLFSDTLIYHWIFNSPLRPVIFSIERTEQELMIDMFSLHLSQNLTWFSDGQDAVDYLDRPEVQALCDDVAMNEHGEQRFFIVAERRGNVEELKRQIERAVKQYGSKLILIDVLTDLLRSLPLDAQDDFMLWQKQMKKEGVVFVNICHTRKDQAGQQPQKDKEGNPIFKRVDEYDIHGSSSIPQSADYNIVLNRDKNAQDPIEKNTTYVDLPKARGGVTGHNVVELYYDPETRQQVDREIWMRENGSKF